MKKHFHNIFKVFFLTVATLGMLHLSSEFDAYHPKPLQYFGSMVEPFKNEGVHITATIYDSYASRNYLHQNLISYGYQPIQITVQNNTPHIFLFSKQGVGLESVSAGDVASTITRGAIPRSIAFKIVSFFFWPFMIPSAIDTIKTWSTHVRLHRDYEAKSVKNCKEAIPPYATVHRILFVRSEHLKKNFNLKLQEYGNRTPYSFSIDAKAIKYSNSTS